MRSGCDSVKCSLCVSSCLNAHWLWEELGASGEGMEAPVGRCGLTGWLPVLISPCRAALLADAHMADWCALQTWKTPKAGGRKTQLSWYMQIALLQCAWKEAAANGIHWTFSNAVVSAVVCQRSSRNSPPSAAPPWWMALVTLSTLKKTKKNNWQSFLVLPSFQTGRKWLLLTVRIMFHWSGNLLRFPSTSPG